MEGKADEIGNRFRRNAIKQAHEEGTTEEQFKNCEITAEQIAHIVSRFNEGDWLAITHGMGPQSGNLLVQQEMGKNEGCSPDNGYRRSDDPRPNRVYAQNTLQKYFREQGIDRDVVAVVNQVVVDQRILNSWRRSF